MVISFRVRSSPGKVTAVPFFTSPTITIRPPVGDKVRGLLHGLHIPRGLDHHGCPFPTRLLQDRRQKLLVGYHHLGSEGTGHLEPGCLDISGNYPGPARPRYFD